MRRVLIFSLLTALALSASPAQAASGAPEAGAASSYIALPTLTATVIRGDGRRRVLTVQAGLDVPDPQLRDRAAMSQPRLRDAYVSALGAYASGAPPLGAPNPDAIVASLQRATDHVLGRQGARFLIGTVMVN